tara:strand:- start:434 stop:667 length:234 start_codon:yes stop_codon:yes gene_type:complete
MEKTETKDLNYYKNNCEEDYIKTPISVLRYISELEAAINYTHSCESDSEQYCECDKPTLGKSVSRCGTCDEWFKPLK